MEFLQVGNVPYIMGDHILHSDAFYVSLLVSKHSNHRLSFPSSVEKLGNKNRQTIPFILKALLPRRRWVRFNLLLASHTMSLWIMVLQLSFGVLLIILTAVTITYVWCLEWQPAAAFMSLLSVGKACKWLNVTRAGSSPWVSSGPPV